MRASRTQQTVEHFTRVAEPHKEGELWGGEATAISFSAGAAVYSSSMWDPVLRKNVKRYKDWREESTKIILSLVAHSIYEVSAHCIGVKGFSDCNGRREATTLPG